MHRKPSLARWIALVCLSLAALHVSVAPRAGVAAPEAEREAAERTFSKAVLIHFEGPINRRLEKYFFRKLAKAKQANADLIIVQIESPGGYVDESFNIANRLFSTGTPLTVAYVPDHALSGAAFVALGCDEIVMHPGARLGDAGPIFLDEHFMFQHAPEKIRSDLAVQVRKLAEEGGRPPALAEAMVDMDLVVYRVENTDTGDITYMSDDEIASDMKGQQWKKIAPVHESREEHFLEATGTRAVELQLATATVADWAELKERYGLTGEVTTYRWGAIDTTVAVLNNSFVTGLLFVVGLVALYIEMSAPGISIGGLISGLCFALFFWSHFLDGDANWLEVILFLSGVVFLAVELFVIPGFGVAGITGFVLMLAGVVLACQEFVIPRSDRQWQTLGTSLMVVAGSGVAFVAVAIVLSRYFRRLPILSQLALRPPHAYDAEQDAVISDKTSPAKANPSPVSQRYNIHVGDWGVADSPLRPAGKARFDDQYVDVTAAGAFVEKGTQVRITEISGNRVVVRAVEETPA